MQSYKTRSDHKAEFAQFSVFVGQNSILHHYYTQTVKDGIQVELHDKQRTCNPFQAVCFS